MATETIAAVAIAIVNGSCGETFQSA